MREPTLRPKAAITTKRPYGDTARAVLAQFDSLPFGHGDAIARELGLHPAYVRKVLYRHGRKVAKRRAAKAHDVAQITSPPATAAAAATNSSASKR